MDVDALREELLEMEWNELRTKARVEYGIQLLPEYKKVDVVNKILASVYSSGDKTGNVMAPKGDTVRAGYARIMLLDSQDEPDPFYINVNGYSASIPRNIEVEIPHEILPSLDAMTYRGLKPDADGVFKPYIKRRAPYTVLQKDDSVPSGKLKFTARRDQSLEKKRRYFDKYNQWPTDGEIKEHIRVNGIKDLFPEGVKSGNVPVAG